MRTNHSNVNVNAVSRQHSCTVGARKDGFYRHNFANPAQRLVQNSNAYWIISTNVYVHVREVMHLLEIYMNSS